MSDLPHLFNTLIRFEIELWNAVDARLRTDHDLPLTWFEPMQIMARLDECRVHDIAQALSITVGGTSKLVDRIEAAGYCLRRANPGDRRSSLVHLTPAGQLLLDAASASFTDELAICLGSAVPAPVLDQFSTTLSLLRDAVRRGDALPTERTP